MSDKKRAGTVTGCRWWNARWIQFLCHVHYYVINSIIDESDVRADWAEPRVIDFSFRVFIKARYRYGESSAHESAGKAPRGAKQQHASYISVIAPWDCFQPLYYDLMCDVIASWCPVTCNCIPLFSSLDDRQLMCTVIDSISLDPAA